MLLMIPHLVKDIGALLFYARLQMVEDLFHLLGGHEVLITRALKIGVFLQEDIVVLVYDLLLKL